MIPIARRIPILVILLALAALLGAGCEKRRLPSTPFREPAQLSRAALQEEADNAFRAAQYDRSEILYNRLLEQQPHLTPAEVRLAHERRVQSALEAGRYNQAMRYLDEFAAADPMARNQWPWHAGYARALKDSGRPEAAIDYLAKLVANPPKNSWEIRSEGSIALSKLLRERNDPAGGLRFLGDAYRRAPDPQARMEFEGKVFRDLGMLTADTFSRLVREAERTRSLNFPYSLVRLEEARRAFTAEGKDSQRGRLILQELRTAGELADKERLLAEAQRPPSYVTPPVPGVPPVAEVPAAPEAPALPAPGTVPPAAPEARPGARHVALTLPLTGRDAAIGWKILRGAWMAEKALAQRGGGEVQVVVINSEAPDWMDRLRGLPQEFQAVGGPLRIDSLTQAKTAGLTNQRAFFAFLPTLGDIREGAEAWRFFPSPEDQVRAVAGLAVHTLGLSRLAVLYPQDRFGQRMAQIFAKEVMDRGATVTVNESYAPGESSQWGKTVARMLGVPYKSAGKNPTPPKSNFEAVFVPDSWSHAQMLVPQFFFYEEDRLLILGPEIWGTAMAAGEEGEARYFRLSAYPGAWWPENPGGGAQTLVKAMEADGAGKPDFWIALGYDFVRLASAMGSIPPSGGSAGVNAALRSAQAIDWSLAPMTWDEQGVSRQSMFLFTPSKGGAVPADPDQLKARLQNIRERHAERYAPKPDQGKKQ